MTDGDTKRIFEKLDSHGERIARVEEIVKHQSESSAAAHKRVETQIGSLSSRLTRHLDVEDANLERTTNDLNTLRQDVHWVRGYIQAKQEYADKNPIVRAVLWILRLFGFDAR